MCLMQDFYLQIMDKEEGDSGKFGFDPLDCTKVTNLLCVIIRLPSLVGTGLYLTAAAQHTCTPCC